MDEERRVAEAYALAGKGSGDSVQAEGEAESGAEGPGELAADGASVKRRGHHVPPPVAKAWFLHQWAKMRDSHGWSLTKCVDQAEQWCPEVFWRHAPGEPAEVEGGSDNSEDRRRAQASPRRHSVSVLQLRLTRSPNRWASAQWFSSACSPSS